MTINKTELALYKVALQFLVQKAISLEVALIKTMDILNTDSHDQAVTVFARAVRDLKENE